jgi:hypothetical protein
MKKEIIKKGSFLKDCCFWRILFILFIDKLIGVQGARLRLGAACLPPENPSRKACDEEASFDVVLLEDAGAHRLLRIWVFIYLPMWLTARPTESEHPVAEINHFQ